MNVSLKTHHSKTEQLSCIRTGVLLTFVLALILNSGSLALANDRIAGTMPGMPVENKAADDQSLNEPVSLAIIPVDYEELESLGTLRTIKNGSLGIDLWDGSNYETLKKLIAALPEKSSSRTIQNLVLRALLTKTDAGLIERKKNPEPGEDLLTLRLEKLIESGFFGEAADLYTLQKDEPYHEKLARSGILALMNNQKTSLACLETKTIEKRFADITFWRQLSQICDHLLLKMAGGEQNDTDLPTEIEKDDLLYKLIEDEEYRFSPEKPEDFINLTNLEQAAIFASKRIDYSNLKIGNSRDMAPSLMLLLLGDKALPNHLQALLMIEATRRGFKTVSDLEEFYESAVFKGRKDDETALHAYKRIREWGRIPFLYQAAKSSTGNDKRALLEESLDLEQEYGFAALLPFAPFWADTKPDDLPVKSLVSAMELMIRANVEIDEAWASELLTKMRKKDTTKQIIMTLLAYNVGHDVPAEIFTEHPEIKDNFLNLSNHKQQIIRIIYEKLDIYGKLHNYGGDKVFEKPVDLTKADSYVMPSIVLLDDLETAQTNKRSGEVILTSAIVLQDVSPDQLYSGVIREVINGLVAVGLTNEARHLATEVILGL